MTSAWPNLSELLGSAPGAPVGMIGAPLSAGSVTAGRCDLAPAELRTVLRRIGRYDVERRSELATAIYDRGDVALGGLTIEAATGPLRQAVVASVAEHPLTLLVGGNNAVTRPGVLGMAEALGLRLEQVGLITLDAHFDLRDTVAGLGNGNPVRALREDGLPGRNIAQVGLAPFANSAAMHQDALDGGHLVMTADEVRSSGGMAAAERALAHLGHCPAILVDCDIDVIDRAQFPGAPGARPGGIANLDFFAAVRRLAADVRVRVVDLTEWDPPLDPTDLSALTAGRWLAELLAGYEAR
ncbi:arginase family protein [Sphingomonas sp. BN140010]|uniref:Arginase family protein n=1 Tax=Sphingomonas arvum TaxID=2992113 RepID=A0ABT3JAV5_9SPHN|nr:arginase family protein [Sphingomonas sp. BN140010]MCW3796202.1 arginase family protein [Sphingomonas sp. BN140010]